MPLHIETQEIRVFKAIYDENGFKRAADKLFVTQSAVSQTLANLERKLETILMERNPLKLTEPGIRFLNYAEAVLGEEQGVLTDINNIKNGILSTLLPHNERDDQRHLWFGPDRKILPGQPTDENKTEYYAKQTNHHWRDIRLVGSWVWTISTEYAGATRTCATVRRHEKSNH